MTIGDQVTITGTSPAGTRTRTLRIGHGFDGRLVVTLYSGTGQFVGNIWLDRDGARQLADAAQRLTGRVGETESEVMS